MHPEIMKDKPGNCPKCGMNLVPVNAEADSSALHQQDADSKPPTAHAVHNMPAGSKDPTEMVNADLNKGAQSFQRYTCPMHPQVVQDAPGKCPLCGMTLAPLTKLRVIAIGLLMHMATDYIDCLFINFNCK